MFPPIPTVDFDLSLSLFMGFGAKIDYFGVGNIHKLFLGHLKSVLGSPHTAEGLLFSNDIQFCL